MPGYQHYAKGSKSPRSTIFGFRPVLDDGNCVGVKMLDMADILGIAGVVGFRGGEDAMLFMFCTIGREML